MYSFCQQLWPLPACERTRGEICQPAIANLFHRLIFSAIHIKIVEGIVRNRRIPSYQEWAPVWHSTDGLLR